MISRRRLLAAIGAAATSLAGMAPPTAATTYYDYRFKFPLAGLPRALAALQALRDASLLDAAQLPENMLGDPRDASGDVVDRYSPDIAWVGRPGHAPGSWTDPQSGEVITVPAAGDPSNYYIAIRSIVPPEQLPINPADYGLIVCDAAESAAVLGVWA